MKGTEEERPESQNVIFTGEHFQSFQGHTENTLKFIVI